MSHNAIFSRKGHNCLIYRVNNAIMPVITAKWVIINVILANIDPA